LCRGNGFWRAKAVLVLVRIALTSGSTLAGVHRRPYRGQPTTPPLSVAAFVVFVLVLALVHAQSVETVTTLSQLTRLAPNTEYRLSTSLAVNTSITMTGAANSVVTCLVLPCFIINATANSDVRFANLTFRFTPTAPPPSSVFRVQSVGHLVLSNLSFRANESERTSLVQWTITARGNLTIRFLGSAAAPVSFQSLASASSLSGQVEAFVFEDSHGSCARGFDCLTLIAAGGAVPISTIALNNVHWRQLGNTTELLKLTGSFTSLSLWRSTTYDQLLVDSAAIRNITIKSCTMYRGIRAKNMSLMHVSDVHFLLEEFVTNSGRPQVFDLYTTNATSFLVENVVATSRLELELHLLVLFNDTDSTVVFRNVTVVGLRGLFLCDQFMPTSGLLRQLTVENVQMRGCMFTTFIVPLGVRRTSIANVIVVDNVAKILSSSPYLLRTASFEEIRVSNFSASGSFLRRDLVRRMVAKRCSVAEQHSDFERDDVSWRVRRPVRWRNVSRLPTFACKTPRQSGTWSSQMHPRR